MTSVHFFALGGMGHTVAASPWTDSTLKVNYLKAEEGPATEVRQGISTTLTLPPPNLGQGVCHNLLSRVAQSSDPAFGLSRWG